MKSLAAVSISAVMLMSHAVSGADELTLSGVRDVKLADAGRFVVTGLPPFARDGTFEFLQRLDGGFTLLSATTMTDGAMRVQARYNYDADWNAVAALGQGIAVGLVDVLQPHRMRAGAEADVVPWSRFAYRRRQCARQIVRRRYGESPLLADFGHPAL